MNTAPLLSQNSLRGRRFIVEAIGFSEAEKSLLASTFRLTSRRMFCYMETSEPGERADIYLVNADSMQALDTLQERKPSVFAPAVLIGRSRRLAEWPLIERPIHWMRLFDQLDAQMEAALAERARRDAATPAWDGRIFRRAGDRKAEPRPIHLEPMALESVLVVDDSPTVRAFMRQKLAPFRFDIDYAETGEKAIDMAQAKHYTCIFLDILMPGIDGYQVCKRIKTRSGRHDTAVVMLSSKLSMFDKFRASWAGCDAYLGKPVGEDELLGTIARFLPSARRVAQSVLSAGAAPV